MQTTTLIRQFLLAVWSSTFALMSGIFSVPFVALAIWSDTKWSRLIGGVMAVLAFLLSSFLVWRKERLRVIELETAAAPRLTIEFADSETFVYEQMGGDAATYRCHRLRITNVGQTPLGWCRVQIVHAASNAGSPSSEPRYRYEGAIRRIKRHFRCGETKGSTWTSSPYRSIATAN